MAQTKVVPSYKQCFLGLLLGLLPLCLLFGILAVFGANTVTFNNQNVYGLPGLLVALLINVVFAALLAGLQKFGYWILGLFGRASTEASA